MVKDRELSLINETKGIHSSIDDVDYEDYARHVKAMKGAGKRYQKKMAKMGLKTIRVGSIICTTHNPPEWELSTIPPGMVLQARTEGTPFEPKHFVGMFLDRLSKLKHYRSIISIFSRSRVSIR